MTATVGLDEIPGPRGVPLLGNIRDIDTAAPFESLLGLAREYGPIFKMATPAGLRTRRPARQASVLRSRSG